MGIEQASEIPEKPKTVLKINPEDLLSFFLEADSYDAEAEVLDHLDELDIDGLIHLEVLISRSEVEARTKLNLLQTKVDILQGEVFELLPNYPVTGKIAVIVNGDPNEDRHVGNVHRSIAVLSKMGFTDFYIAHDGNVPEVEGRTVRQYPATKGGVSTLLTEVGDAVEKDNMVFFYSTGHGQEQPKEALSLKDGSISVDEVTQGLTSIKEKGGRGVFVFDNCFTGAFPHAIIESGIEGVSFSSAIVGEVSLCQFFSPEVFRLIEEGCDTNRDHLTTAQEVYQAAMAHYRLETRTNEFGEISSSLPEMNESNYEKLLSSPQPTLVVFRTTWCPSCEVLDKELARMWGVLGGQLNVVQVTSDKNPKFAQELAARMGIPEVNAFPTVYSTNDQGVSLDLLTVGFRSKEELAQDLEDKLDITFSEEAIIASLVKRTDKSTKEVAKFVANGIIDYQVIARINFFDDFITESERYPKTYSMTDKAFFFSKGIEWNFFERNSYLSDVPARRLVGLVDSYDGDWMSSFELNSPYRIAGYTGEQIVDIVWNVVNQGDENFFAAYSDKFSFKDKLRLAKNDIDANIANSDFAKYPDEIPYDYRVELIVAGFSPKDFSLEWKKPKGAFLSISQRCRILAKLKHFPDNLDEAYQAYAESFDAGERVYLMTREIESDSANRYSEVLNASNVVSLVELGISQEDFLADVEAYPMFSTNTIIYFNREGIDLDLARQFDSTRFNLRQVRVLLKGEAPRSVGGGFTSVPSNTEPIPPVVANLYHRRLTENEIRRCYSDGLMPEDVNDKVGRFKDLFDEHDVPALLIASVPVDQANEYSAVFTVYKGYRIGAFYQKGLLVPELKDFIDTRFSPEDLELFMANEPRVTAAVALSYDESFYANSIILLLEAGVDSIKANQWFKQYNQKRFQHHGSITLLAAQVPPSIANKYPKGFDPWEIVNCHTNGISPAQAALGVKQLPNRFDEWAKAALFTRGVTSDEVKIYPAEIDVATIITLHEKGIPPNEGVTLLSEYLDRFDSHTKIRFINLDITPAMANSYPESVAQFYVEFLHEEGIDGASATKLMASYDGKFDSNAKVRLILAKFPPDEANAYAKDKSLEEVQVDELLQEDLY